MPGFEYPLERLGRILTVFNMTLLVLGFITVVLFYSLFATPATDRRVMESYHCRYMIITLLQYDAF